MLRAMLDEHTVKNFTPRQQTFDRTIKSIAGPMLATSDLFGLLEKIAGYPLDQRRDSHPASEPLRLPIEPAG